MGNRWPGYGHKSPWHGLEPMRASDETPWSCPASLIPCNRRSTGDMAVPSASTSIHPARAKFAGQRRSSGHRRRAGEHIRRGRSPLVADALVEVRTDATINRAAIDAQRLDETSRAWLDALDSHSLHREEAIGRLHALLLREARFDVRRRSASLA